MIIIVRNFIYWVYYLSLHSFLFVISLIVFGYLMYVLIKPEKF